MNFLKNIIKFVKSWNKKRKFKKKMKSMNGTDHFIYK